MSYAVVGVTHGTATITGNVVTFQPAVGFVGPAVVEFTASDGFAISSIQTVTIEVRRRPPVISAQPVSQGLSSGSLASFSASSENAATFQWQRNGQNLADATDPELKLTSVEPSHVGIYQVTMGNAAGYSISTPAILGITTSNKVVGTGRELSPTNITHANGNIFDQILLEGPAATITADPGQVTRISFVDLNNDIVQVEFSGAGSLSLVLDNSSGPAAPGSYNQPGVGYMRGHVALVITAADETTNVGVFAVGRITAFDPTGGYNILRAPGGDNDDLN
jgi:hypothetical protein